MRMKFWVVLMILGTTVSALRADEGMWLPLLVERYQIGDMQEKGFRLSAEDIYSVNQACLKDAVVHFGGGCTGEVISAEGLVLTNHHCGYGAIQRHSSVENDYLKEGFWAMDRSDELPNPGLKVRFLRSMEEVTGEVLKGIEPGMDADERERAIKESMGRLIREATSDTHLEAAVNSFYYGNAYYLFVYETYPDVRLVGAPPESVGNFGRDNDNWIWPRHTGDFSLFRIYANGDNEPADYSPENQPYHPVRHLEINAGGVEEGDFTMVMGYPALTQQYLHSSAVKQLVQSSYPLRVDLRTQRLEIMDRHMKSSDKVRIQYASKYRRVSNAWKKWQGVILGMQRNRVCHQKIEEEAVFAAWVQEDGERVMKYEDILGDFEKLYAEKEAYSMAVDMLSEGIRAVELFRQEEGLRALMVKGSPVESIRSRAEGFFKDYYVPIDREIFAAMMEAYHEYMPVEKHPDFFTRVDKKFKGDFRAYADWLYWKSLFASEEATEELLEIYAKDGEKALKKLRKDPVAMLQAQFKSIYSAGLLEAYNELVHEENDLYRTYMAGLMEMADSVRLFPDANRTMRVSYGKAEGYSPLDAVEYAYIATIDGLMAKAAQDVEDYRIPERLRELYAARDYGPYEQDGTLPLCFVASNHTSGGNSGSPVLDAHGRLIGLNFDREWEGVMSDFYFDPQLSRNISVDIRYVLFLIDKFAGAGYLLEEMDIHFEDRT